MPSILFIVPHRPDRSPSQRYRFEQYIPYFEAQGYKCHWAFLLNEKDDKIFYANGHFIKKAWLNVKFVIKRIKDVIVSGNYDLVFIQREAIFLGTSVFEYLFSLRTKVIFDFDDAIWLPNVSESNKKFLWLKNPSKVKKALKYADHVIAGNQYLADFAGKYNSAVTIIPTTIDTEKYNPVIKKKDKEYVCIGWTGSLTTVQHLKNIMPVLEKLKREYGNKLKVKVISDNKVTNNFVEFVKWNPQTEVEDLADIDIGIMPLPDDEWSKGKCGLKALQYMALEIPAVVSPIGVNTEIVKNGVNGFWASSGQEWYNKLRTLIEDSALRTQMGYQARKTVLESYSVNANKDKYIKIFEKLIKP